MTKETGSKVEKVETAVVEKKETAIALSEETLYEFKGDIADILMPKILAAQSTSKAVQEGKVQLGQLYRSTNNEVLGDKVKPLSIILLHQFKNWIVSKKEGTRFVFKRFEEHTRANDNLPWNWTDLEGEWKREKNLSFYVLIPSDIERCAEAKKLSAAAREGGEIPDVDAALMPCLISFKSTSYKAGQKLVSHFAMASDMKVPPYGTIFNVAIEKSQNSQGIFQVLTVEKGGKVNKDLYPACKEWFFKLLKANVKIHEEEESVVETEAASTKFDPMQTEEF